MKLGKSLLRLNPFEAQYHIQLPCESITQEISTRLHLFVWIPPFIAAFGVIVRIDTPLRGLS